MSTYIFWFPVALYLAGWLGEFLSYASQSGDRLRWTRGLLGVAWGAHALLLISLAIQEGVSLSVLLIAVAWLTILIYYAMMRRVGSQVFPFIFPPFSIALLITAFFGSEQALLGGGGFGFTLTTTRNILTAHIITVLAGILLFGLACLTSIVYLYQEHQIKAKLSGLAVSRLPALGTLENYNHKAIILGFFFLSVGLLLGLIVAGVNTLPHRLFSLRQVIPTINWLVYAIFLVSHDLQGRRGRFGAFWSIVGFAVVVASLVFEILFLTARA